MTTLNLPTDPALHPDESAASMSEYRGVTRILRHAGLMADWQVAEETLERGSDVHKLCFDFDKGRLNRRQVPKKYKGYLRAWKRYLHETNAKVILAEEFVSNETYKLRGRLDRLVKPNFGVAALLEIKTGEPQPHTRIQLAGYGWLYDPRTIFRRLTVRLYPSGKYSTKAEYPMAEYFDDAHTFLAAARVTDFKRRFNL